MANVKPTATKPATPPPVINRAKLAELRWLVEEFNY